MREIYNELSDVIKSDPDYDDDYDNWLLRGMKADAAQRREIEKKRKDKEKRRAKRKRTGR